MQEEKRIRIILAEDQQILLDGLAEILNKEPNIEIVGKAINGRQALNLIEIHQPDLIILDIRMPIMSGVEVAEVVKKKFPKIKILILSLHADQNYINKLLELGVDGYILKERGKLELIAAIETIMDGKIFVGQAVGQAIVEYQYKKKKVEVLTKREKEILVLVAKGYSSAQIASIISIGRETVNTYRRNIREKLNIKGAANFVSYALKHGYITLKEIEDSPQKNDS